MLRGLQRNLKCLPGAPKGGGGWCSNRSVFNPENLHSGGETTPPEEFATKELSLRPPVKSSDDYFCLKCGRHCSLLHMKGNAKEVRNPKYDPLPVRLRRKYNVRTVWVNSRPKQVSPTLSSPALSTARIVQLLVKSADKRFKSKSGLASHKQWKHREDDPRDAQLASKSCEQNGVSHHLSTTTMSVRPPCLRLTPPATDPLSSQQCRGLGWRLVTEQLLSLHH